MKKHLVLTAINGEQTKGHLKFWSLLKSEPNTRSGELLVNGRTQELHTFQTAHTLISLKATLDVRKKLGWMTLQEDWLNLHIVHKGTWGFSSVHCTIKGFYYAFLDLCYCSLKNYLIFIYVYVCMFVYGGVHMCIGTPRDQSVGSSWDRSYRE